MIECPVCGRGVNVRDDVVATHNGRGRPETSRSCPMSGKAHYVETTPVRLRDDMLQLLVRIVLHRRHVQRAWSSKADAGHRYLERHKMIECTATGRARMPSLWEVTPLGVAETLPNFLREPMLEIARGDVPWSWSAASFDTLAEIGLVAKRERFTPDAAVAAYTEHGKQVAEALAKRLGKELGF